MTLDERQREITIKSKKGTSPGFQVSELLEAKTITITMQYNTLKYQYKYKYNTIIKMKIKERNRRALDSEYLNKWRQIPTESNYQDKEDLSERFIKM